QPAIIAMPSDGLWGDGSGYVPHAVQNFEKWIGEELPALARQTIEVVGANSPFFISGLSMGGYGAFRIGLKYPTTYQGISAHSAMTSIEQMKSMVEEDWSFWEEKQMGHIEQFIIAAHTIPSIRFDCGLEDTLILPNRQLHAFLVDHHIKHQYQEFPGGHDWPYWQEKIKETYRFFSNELNERF
ncbi:MAG: alpha/beta hydrolase-fold protein, partial [Bacteroidota bacterium]